VPRVDINAPANAIEYYPALLAHTEENGAGSSGNSDGLMPASHLHASMPVTSGATSDSDDDSDITDEGDLSDDSICSYESDLDVVTSAMSPADRAEYERFGAEYAGPVLTDDVSARLLVLMLHASTCPGRYVGICSVIRMGS
jgi:hypothetical protein